MKTNIDVNTSAIKMSASVKLTLGCLEKKMLYMCYGVDGPDGEKKRDGARKDHFEYLQSNQDILVLGGATLTDDSDDRTGSLLIINVKNRAAADLFAEGEPLRKAGVFESYSVSRMRRGQWFPDNAPASPEGD